MKTLRATLIISLALSAGVVFAQSVKTDYEKSFDFSKLKTFDFKDQQRRQSDPLASNPIADRRIQTALEKQLVANGYKRVTNGEPDFLIAYYANTKERLSVRDYNYGLPRRRWGTDIRAEYHTEGTVMVDFVDGQTNQLVWRGYATDTIDPDKSEKQINKGAEKLIEEFLEDIAEKK